MKRSDQLGIIGSVLMIEPNVMFCIYRDAMNHRVINAGPRGINSKPLSKAECLKILGYCALHGVTGKVVNINEYAMKIWAEVDYIAGGDLVATRHRGCGGMQVSATIKASAIELILSKLPIPDEVM